MLLRMRDLLSIDFIKRLWPLLLPVLLLIPGMGGFPYPSSDGAYSDMAISHFPNALFLKQTILETGQIPLWSPSILSGYPFYANPLSGLHYPPGWLALLFPLPLGMNFTVILHLIWGGVGMYAFLRSQQLSHIAGLFGALAFEALPKVFAHFGAGHITLLFALSWTPWLFYARSGKHRNDVKIPAAIFALMILADPRWAMFAGAVWLLREMSTAEEPVLKRLKRAGSLMIIAGFLASPLLLPLTEYVFLSTRAHLSINDVFAFSMPPARLLGVLFPDFSGNHEWMAYFGGIVSCFIVITLVSKAQFGRRKFWILILFASLLISLGEYFPPLKLAAGIPGVSLLRVPARALFLSGFAAAVLAGIGMDQLLLNPGEPMIKRARLILVFLMAIAVAFFTTFWSLNGRIPANVAWGTAVILAGGIWIFIYFTRQIKREVWVWVVFSLLLIDLGRTNATLFDYRSQEEVLSEGKDAAKYLSSIPGTFRIYSPSYSLPQQTAAFFGLELADGVDPLQLEDYVEFMERATGIPDIGYSITLPPFEGGDPQKANEGYSPNSQLADLNVRFVVSQFELDVDRAEVLKIGNSWIYELIPPPLYIHTRPPDLRQVTLLARTPNRIEFSAVGPGNVIISEIPYPGWQVWIDGERGSWENINGINRSVMVGEGQHQVAYILRPTSLYFGLGLAIITLGAMLRFRESNRKDIQND